MAFDFQAAYDELNPTDDDYRFYAEFAATRGTQRAIDLGCGTGTLARLLSSRGIDVIGVDPDPEMIRVARSKPPIAGPAGSVEWRLGYSHVLDSATADLAVMSGHVAQVFTGEVSWRQALSDVRRALTEGGALAFESRNPTAPELIVIADRS